MGFTGTAEPVEVLNLFQVPRRILFRVAVKGFGRASVAEQHAPTAVGEASGFGDFPDAWLSEAFR
jgi:hypothetical protein